VPGPVIRTSVVLSLMLTTFTGCSFVVSENNAQADPAVEPAAAPSVEPAVSPGVEPDVSDAGEPDVVVDGGEPDVPPEPTPTPTPDVPPPPAVDLSASQLTTTDGVVADGVQTVRFLVQLVLDNGAPAADVDLSWSKSGVGDWQGDLVVVTDGNGEAEMFVTSVVPGELQVTVDVDDAQLGPVTAAFSECVSDAAFFAAEVQPVLGQCVGCHNAYGRSAELGAMALHFADDPDGAERNRQLLSSYAFDVETLDGSMLPYLLAKPADVYPTGHFGGLVASADTDTYQALLAFTERLQSPQTCPDEPDPAADFWQGVDVMDNTQTLREASFVLTGTYPSAAEVAAFDGSDAALRAFIDDKMQTPEFGVVLREWFNDVLYVDNTGGIRNSLNEDDHPSLGYFNRCNNANGTRCCGEEFGKLVCCQDNTDEDADFCERGRQENNRVFERAPLFHIADVVQSGRPVGDILTDNVRYVNPYTARMLGLEANFDADPANDLVEYLPTQVVPTGRNGLDVAETQGGVLTSPAFLRQYPTSNTNVQRHRARNVYRVLLDLDVMTFLELVIDTDEDLGEDPFTDARTCSSCHAALDPVAAAFKNFRNQRKNVRDQYPGLRGPSYRGVYSPLHELSQLPEDRSEDALRWLGEQVRDDERFTLAMAAHAFRFVTGLKTLSAPQDRHHDDHQAHLLAFNAQRQAIDDLKQLLDDHNQDFRVVVREALMSRWFRAKGVLADALPDDVQRRAWALAGIGGFQVHTPAALDRKLRAVVGIPYNRGGTVASANALLTDYRLLLGGIDSNAVLERNQEPTPLSAAVARRMANEVSCVAVPQHFARDFGDTDFIVDSDKTTVPLDDNGAVIVDNESKIMADLQRMHAQLLGEVLDDDDPRLLASYDLFVEAWQLMQGEGNTLNGRCRAEHDFYDESIVYEAESTETPTTTVQVRTDPDKVVRAFMAVASALMADPVFLLHGRSL